MKYHILILGLTFLIPSHTIMAQELVTDNARALEVPIQESGNGTLVIFDVDDVLLQPTSMILKYRNKEAFNQILEELEFDNTPENMDKLYKKILEIRSVEVLDPMIPKIISYTQDRGLKVMAITAVCDRKIEELSLGENRSREVNALGYDFKRSWEDVPHIIFNDMPTSWPNVFPSFKDGILFTCDHPKGEVLEAFLKEYSYIRTHPISERGKEAPNDMPKEISKNLFTKLIYVDNQVEPIQSYDKFATDNDFPHFGILYTKSETSPLSKEVIESERKIIMKLLEPEMNTISQIIVK
jgi:hypothetical protein